MIWAAGVTWFMTWAVQILMVLVWWTVPFRLPAWYYELRPNVRTSRRTLRWSGLRLYARVAHRINPLAFDRRNPGHASALMTAAETTHAVSFLIVMLVAMVALTTGSSLLAGFLVFWNGTFNLYPVILQRHNRARLSAVTARNRRGRPARVPRC